MIRSFLIAFCCLVPMAAHASIKRIGYVDLRKALNSVDDGRKAKKKLQRKKKKFQVKLNRAQTRLKREQKLFKRRATILRGGAKRKAQLKLQKEFLKLREMYAKLTRELARDEAKETRVIFAKMNQIIQKIAEKEGLDLVLEKTESSILFARASMDYTNELIRMYNKRYGRKGRRVSRRKRRRRKRRRRKRRRRRRRKK